MSLLYPALDLVLVFMAVRLLWVPLVADGRG